MAIDYIRTVYHPKLKLEITKEEYEKLSKQHKLYYDKVEDTEDYKKKKR